jgi:threonyl-tRNA synthetase
MIHRAIFGSIERFMGILIEHFAGKFPLWLAPIQVKIMTISDKQQDYAKKLEKILKDKFIRVSLDLRAEKIGYKIREAQLQKVPYLVVIGDKEMGNQTLAVREHGANNSKELKIDEFIGQLISEITAKTIKSQGGV